MRAVTVVGGGFSGLATAYYLSRAGIPVEIVEKTDRLGGLIATLQTPHGPVETAAIGMRNFARVDAVCRDLGLQMLCSTRSSSRRSLHLPPATQAVAIEPRGVARARRAVRDGDGAGLALASAARDRRTIWCACGGTSGDPVAPRSNPSGHIRRRSCVPERLARVWRAGAARATCTEGPGVTCRRDAATDRRPRVAPADARREHSPEYPCTAGWLDAGRHLHIGPRCGGMPPGRCTGRQPGAVDD